MFSYIRCEKHSPDISSLITANAQLERQHISLRILILNMLLSLYEEFDPGSG